jgi:hypothetical protein
MAKGQTLYVGLLALAWLIGRTRRLAKRLTVPESLRIRCVPCWLNDVRYAIRMMRRTPTFTAAVGRDSRARHCGERDHLQPRVRGDLPSFAASVLNFLSWRD